MVKNLLERTRDRLESRETEGEQGSLILDILIGMAIFGLIALIAASAVGQYRERAYVQGATSDVNALGLALEASFTDNFRYPVATPIPTPASLGVNLTPNNSIGSYSVAANGEAFRICVAHRTGTSFNAAAYYDSGTGGLKGTQRGGSYTTAAAACTAAGYTSY